MNKITAEDFWSVWTEPVAPVPSVFYRLYHNNDGSPVGYTMEDLPGNYIEVDKDTYLIGSFNVKVVNQKLVYLSTVKNISKLKPNNTGTACDPQDICVVVTENVPHVKWSL